MTEITINQVAVSKEKIQLPCFRKNAHSYTGEYYYYSEKGRGIHIDTKDAKIRTLGNPEIWLGGTVESTKQEFMEAYKLINDAISETLKTLPE